VNSITVLPTTYNGHRFRSRLEARWAALFDQFQIRWIYEPEGFQTQHGNYLPDFYFPDINAFCEVKPGPNMFNREIAEAIARETKSDFLVLDSPSVECRAYPYFRDGFWDDMAWCMSEKYLGPDHHDDEPRFYISCGSEIGSATVSKDCPCCGYLPPKAFSNVRALRFENGVAAW
jgi:hypothetical protein